MKALLETGELVPVTIDPSRLARLLRHCTILVKGTHEEKSLLLLVKRHESDGLLQYGPPEVFCSKR